MIRIHAGENDSLRNNVANSLACVTEALEPGQRMPSLRIGHGLYTRDLRTPGGQKLLEDLRKNGVTLEFQITSNVRLNNLSRLDHHPLKQYLAAGIDCVQGTDGGALYGTDSIDEELSLEKLLGLGLEELSAMAAADRRILAESRRIFEARMKAFREGGGAGDPEKWYLRRLEETAGLDRDLWKDSGRADAWEALRDRIAPLPEHRIPVIVAGGSFSRSARRATVREEDRRLLDRLLETLDPERVFFVIGHRVSIESSGPGLYKSFAYEIFKRRPSVLLTFEGNAPAMNLIQEARNGRYPCGIFVNPRSRGLAVKAKLLDGYVLPLENPEEIAAAVGRLPEG